MKKAEKLLSKIDERLMGKSGIEDLIDIVLVSGGDVTDIIDLLATATLKRSILMKDNPANGKKAERWKRASILLQKCYKDISKRI